MAAQSALLQRDLGEKCIYTAVEWVYVCWEMLSPTHKTHANLWLLLFYSNKYI